MKYKKILTIILKEFIYIHYYNLIIIQFKNKTGAINITNSISEYTCLEEKTIYEYILGLQKENSCLKSNWVNLKKWLLNDHFLYIPEVGANSPYNTVLRKMEELEKRKESIR